MATATVYASATDGYLRKACVTPTYAGARDATSADTVTAGDDDLWVGWNYKIINLGTMQYENWLNRAYLYFDTSSIPAAAEITAATLKVYLYWEDSPPTGHDIILYSGQPTYPSAALAASDFDRQLYAGGGASDITAWRGSSGLLTFTLNATGYGWITKGGTTKLCLRSEFDVSPTLPNVDMLAKFYSSEKGGAYRPVLTVTYGTKPTVTTDAATSIGSSYATGEGTITDNGSDAITAYGAIWNDDGTDPVDLAHADNFAEGSDLAGGEFSADMTGLSASTAYLYRAYATSAAGTGYGSAVEFTTSAPADCLTVVTQEATAIADTTATLNGRITEDEGDTITQHGFIWKKNSDPYEEASPIHNPTGADNYVLLGTGAEGAFTTGVTGLDTGAAYLYRGFATSTGGTTYGGMRVIRTGDEYEDEIDGTTADGYAQKLGSGDTTEEAKSASFDASSADSVSTSDTTLPVTVYLYKLGDPWKCLTKRSFVYFDTSSIPSDVTITAATLSVYIDNIYETAGHDAGTIYVSNGQPTYPHATLEVGDYDDADYSDVATLARGSITVDQYNDITLPTTVVTKGGTTKLRLDQTATCGSDGAINGYLLHSASGTNKPTLTVTYTLAGDPPPFPQINVGGTMKDTANAFLRVGGQWRLVTKVFINATGSAMTGAA